MAETFRSRAALRSTVEAAARKFANRTGIAVHLYQVQGGFEGLNVGRPGPAGTQKLLGLIVPAVPSGVLTSDPDPEEKVIGTAQPVHPLVDLANVVEYRTPDQVQAIAAASVAEGAAGPKPTKPRTVFASKPKATQPVLGEEK